jgi:hypothetical protein
MLAPLHYRTGTRAGVSRSEKLVTSIRVLVVMSMLSKSLVW